MAEAPRVSNSIDERNFAVSMATAREMSTPVKISVTLTRGQYNTLQKLAAEQGIAAADALQKAIVTEDFIKTQIKAGKKILIQDKDNTMQQVIFR
jgi:hypothetical protein